MSLRVDAGELFAAISDHSMEWYLDRETGGVIPAHDGGLEPGDEADLDLAKLAEDPRFVLVEPVASGTAYDWMADFIDGLNDAKARRTLMHAIEGKRPFRRFKDALDEFPAIRSAWFEFEEARLTRVATEWLRDEGIDAALTIPPRTAE